MWKRLLCFLFGHNTICLGKSEMQGELWTVYDWKCVRCGLDCNSSRG